MRTESTTIAAWTVSANNTVSNVVVLLLFHVQTSDYSCSVS